MKEFENLSESELITLILSGNKSLYEIIVRRYNPILYKIGRSYNYNHQDTQDLMQDTFIDCYRSLDKFAHRSHFKTWIVKIMLNNCFRKKQKFSFKNEITQEIKEEAKPMFINENNQLEKIVHSHELGNIIENALLNIPFDYRIVFSLREINGFDVEQTAELLDISHANVKTRLTRSKAMLRKELEKKYSPSELFDFNLIYCDLIVQNVMNVINKEN